MRSALLTYIGVMCSLAMVMIISIITMKSSYYEVIRQSLDDSMEYSISMLQLDRSLGADSLDYDDIQLVGGGYRDINWENNDDWVSASSSSTDKLQNDEYFKKRFVEYITSLIDSRVDSLSIDIYGADSEYGVISAEITAEFTYPFGVKDSVSVYKTIILNREIE